MTRDVYLQEFKKTLDEMYEIAVKKNHDYAGENNPFQNFEMCERLGICSIAEGIAVRMSDKMMRVCNLLKRDAKVADEKITDTLLDLSNYSIILKLLLQSKSK